MTGSTSLTTRRHRFILRPRSSPNNDSMEYVPYISAMDSCESGRAFAEWRQNHPSVYGPIRELVERVETEAIPSAQ
jgi:hypothetical protein